MLLALGHVLREAVEVAQAADFLGLAQALQVFINGDDVGRLACVDQARDASVDQPVLVAVKVAVEQQIAHAIPGMVVEQQAAEHARLGLDRVRRHTQLRSLRVRRRQGIGFIKRRENSRHGFTCERTAN